MRSRGLVLVAGALFVPVVAVLPVAADHFPADDRSGTPYPIGNARCSASVPPNSVTPRSHALMSWSDNGKLVFRASGVNDLPATDCEFMITVKVEALGSPGSIWFRVTMNPVSEKCTAPAGGLCSIDITVDWSVFFYDGLHVYIGTLLKVTFDFWMNGERLEPPAVAVLSWPCSYGVEADPVCTSPPGGS